MTGQSLSLPNYIADAFAQCAALSAYATPWDMTTHATDAVRATLRTLGAEFATTGDVAVHRGAIVEAGAVIRGPAVISDGCVIAAHAYLREGVFLGRDVRIGPSCEVKASFIFGGSTLAHLNYVGNSLIGARVNIEAGAVLANHFNERQDKRIIVVVRGRSISTGVEKFGALVGDDSRVGANAVTTPGTVLPPGSVVGRLELVEQAARRKGSVR